MIEALNQDEFTFPDFELEKRHKRFKLIARLTPLVFVPWLAISVVTLVNNNPEWFARLGSLGVASAILAFAILRSAWNSYELGVRSFLFSIIRIGFSKSFKYAEAQGTYAVLKAVGTAQPEAQEQVDKLVTLLKSNKIDSDIMMRKTIDRFEFWQKREARFSVAEICLAAVATIQWGYGDVIVNKLVNCGEWVC